MSCQETNPANPTIVQILQLLDANTKTVNNLKNQAAMLRSLTREDLHAIMRTHEVMTSAAPLVFKKLASKPVSLDKDTESINESIKELISHFGDVLNSWHEHVHIAFLAFDLIKDHGTLEDLENMVPRIKGIWEEKEEMETFLMMRAKYMQCLLKEVSLSNIEAPTSRFLASASV